RRGPGTGKRAGVPTRPQVRGGEVVWGGGPEQQVRRGGDPASAGHQTARLQQSSRIRHAHRGAESIEELWVQVRDGRVGKRGAVEVRLTLVVDEFLSLRERQATILVADAEEHLVPNGRVNRFA